MKHAKVKTIKTPNKKGQAIFPSENPGSGYSSQKKKVKPDRRAFQHSFPKFKLAN